MDRTSLLLVLGLASARLLSFVARTFVVAFFPELMLRYSVGYTEVGTLYSAYFWVYVLCMIPAGWLADRRSPRAMVVGGLVLIAAGHLAFPYSPTWEWATASRGLMGLGTALVFGPVYKLITVHLSGPTRAKGYAWMEMSSSSGMLIGLAILPMMAARLDLKALGIGMFVLTLISATCLALLRLPLPPSPSWASGSGSAKPHFVWNFTWLSMSLILSNAGTTSVFAWLPTNLRNGMGMTAVESSLVMGLLLLAAVGGAFVTSQIVDRVGAIKIATTGIFIFSLGLVLLLPGQVFLAIVGAPLMGFGTTSMFSCLMMMGSTLSPARTGQVIGAMTASGQASTAAAGILFGWILDLTGSFTSIWLLGLASMVGSALALALVRQERSDPEGQVA